MRRVLWTILALTLLVPVHGTVAQPTEANPQRAQGTLTSPVLTIDSERMFLESAFGKRVVAEIEAEGARLASENRKIEADLKTEEQALTEKRAEMTAEDFRALADVFDTKVQETRSAQEAKGRALTALLDRERDVFLRASAPVLERLMRNAGAAVILESRSVFVSASAIEITDDAIALLDETLGAGPD